jgi:rSAM/selenodomain-associated transferase 1
MRAAFRQAFADGYRQAVLVGTDVPLLGPEALAHAFAELEAHDLVLGPTLDGGYYLVGLKRHAPELFRHVPWSTPEVLAVTLARASACGISCRLLPRLRDVDTARDLQALRRELAKRARTGVPFPRRTFEVLSRPTRKPTE